MSAPCQVCGHTTYPHECMVLPTIWNSLYYCAPGREHRPKTKRWWQRHPRCADCDAVLTAPRSARSPK